MNTEPQTFADVISLWPTVGALATDIGVKEVTARQWKLRGNIPGEYWAGIVLAALTRTEKGEEAFAAVTLDLLARLAVVAAAERREDAA